MYCVWEEVRMGRGENIFQKMYGLLDLLFGSPMLVSME
jgi:hypothetical protein